jgi:catechol 2,3-dioxygenase-like lactoylglutathione lyase family enzyme
MTTTRAQLHHVAITVHDFDRSLPWYEAVFGIAYRMDVPHEGGVGKLMTDDAWQLALVLHEHDNTPASITSASPWGAGTTCSSGSGIWKHRVWLGQRRLIGR